MSSNEEHSVGIPNHGTRYAYQKLKCRCEECRQANRLYLAQYRRSTGQVSSEYKPRMSAQHGTRQKYTKGKCRCELCVKANSAYQREYMRMWRKGVKMHDERVEQALRSL